MHQKTELKKDKARSAAMLKQNPKINAKRAPPPPANPPLTDPTNPRTKRNPYRRKLKHQKDVDKYVDYEPACCQEHQKAFCCH
mmetsp:Transcript_20322/g.24905  ORF Transcript_20322/g.24905 Transcript_20322/m.24905 type:complete len:83 (-) Transcript_20322:76-324(-)